MKCTLDINFLPAVAYNKFIDFTLFYISVAGASSFISTIFSKHSKVSTSVSSLWTTPTPSLSWTVLTQTRKTLANIEAKSLSTKIFPQNAITKSTTSSAVESSAHSSASITLSNLSTPFYISPSIEKRQPVEVSIGMHTVTNPSKLTEYSSKSNVFNTFSHSTHHTIISQTIQRSNILQDIISNASLFSQYISAVSQIHIDSSISEGFLVSSMTSSLPSLAILSTSILPSVIQNSPYTTTFISNGTISPSLDSSQMNIIHSVQYTMLSKNLQNLAMNTTQLQSIFTSMSYESNNASLGVMDSSYHTPYSDFMPMNSSLIKSSHIQLHSLRMVYASSAPIMHSESAAFYGTVASRHGSRSISRSKLHPTTSTPNFMKNTRKFGHSSKHDIPSSETFLPPLMTPTVKNPLDDVDREEKNKEDKGIVNFCRLSWERGMRAPWHTHVTS